MLVRISLGEFNQTKIMVENFYEVRKEIFNNMPSTNYFLGKKQEQEIDQFDHHNCHYILAFSDTTVIGGVRLTSSIYPNLTFNFFKENLPSTLGIERASDLLEISKLGIKPIIDAKQPYQFKLEMLELLDAIFQFALDNNYKKVITVIEPTMERMLKTLWVSINHIKEISYNEKTKLAITTFDINTDQHQKLKNYRKNLSLLS